MWRAWSPLVIILCATGLSARAEEAPIGYVKTLSGTATVTHGGIATAAALAMPVYEHDRLETGGNGELGVTFRDNTRISLGPDGRIELKHYVFKPASEEYGFLLSWPTEPWNTFRASRRSLRRTRCRSRHRVSPSAHVGQDCSSEPRNNNEDANSDAGIATGADRLRSAHQSCRPVARRERRGGQGRCP